MKEKETHAYISANMHFWYKRLSASEFLGQDTPKSYIISRWSIPFNRSAEGRQELATKYKRGSSMGPGELTLLIVDLGE